LIQVTSTGPDKRTRAPNGQAPALWALTPAEHDLLVKWVRAGAAESRRIAGLRKLAGVARLEPAERLIERLLAAGWISLDERRENGFWLAHTLRWLNLVALQSALGLPTQADRDSAREILEAKLATLVESADGDIQAAGKELLLQQSSLPTSVRQQRAELLDALHAWQQEKRRGMRQDFALFARPHSKAITETEWKWLGERVALEELGVERFAPVFWVSGNCSLRLPTGVLDLACVPFLGVPTGATQQLFSVDGAVESYWFIENRASFERQCAKRATGMVLVFIAGRPNESWQAAAGRLLRCAPAPVHVSADADPAGLEIALTVGSVVQAAGCKWEPRAMDLVSVESGKPLPLNAYDRAAIARLRARADIPAAMVELLDHIERRGAKYEQEAWL
jgi:hypothetical protein